MALVGKNRMDSVARIMTSINALAALALIYDLPVEDFLDTVLVTTNVANIILMAIEFGFIAFVVAIYNAVQGFRTRLKTAVRSQQAMHQTRGEDLAEAAIEDDSVTIHEMIMADNAGASVVDLNFARENGKTPLHMAVELDNVEVATWNGDVGEFSVSRCRHRVPSEGVMVQGASQVGSGTHDYS